MRQGKREDRSCPPRLEELKKEAQGILSPDIFDGARFEFNKTLTQKFQLNHNITLGSSQVVLLSTSHISTLSTSTVSTTLASAAFTRTPIAAAIASSTFTTRAVATAIAAAFLTAAVAATSSRHPTSPHLTSAPHAADLTPCTVHQQLTPHTARLSQVPSAYEFGATFGDERVLLRGRTEMSGRVNGLVHAQVSDSVGVRVSASTGSCTRRYRW